MRYIWGVKFRRNQICFAFWLWILVCHSKLWRHSQDLLYWYCSLLLIFCSVHISFCIHFVPLFARSHAKLSRFSAVVLQKEKILEFHIANDFLCMPREYEFGLKYISLDQSKRSLVHSIFCKLKKCSVVEGCR